MPLKRVPKRKPPANTQASRAESPSLGEEPPDTSEEQ